MASVKLILRIHQADKKGECPLYIRVIKDRKTKFISTGYKFKPNQWDEENQRAKKNFPNSARMNACWLKRLPMLPGKLPIWKENQKPFLPKD